MNEVWTAERVEQLLALMYKLNVVSLDTPVEKVDGEMSDCSLKDCVMDISPGPQEIVELQDRKMYLISCVKRLKPREQAVIMHRYGLIDGKFYTLEEIGRMYGVSRERIRQIESKAVKKLREIIVVKDKHKHVYDI